MTSKEVKAYIKSLGKESGEYTEEEVYDICMKFKSIPNKRDKNWDELANILDFKGRTGKSLRSWMLKEQKDRGELPKNPSLLSSRNIEEATDKEIDMNFQEQVETLYKEKQKIRDIKNAYYSKLRDDSRIEEILDAIRTCVDGLNALPKVKIHPMTKNLKAEVVVNFADAHLGDDVNLKINHYDIDEFIVRVNNYISKTGKYCKLHNVRRLDFINLGDLISGYIHSTLRYEQGMDAIEQVMKVSEVVAQTLNQLQECAPEIIYRGVTDNHSRIMPDKKQSIEKENLCRITEWFLQTRLENTKIKFSTEDNFDNTLGAFELLNGEFVCYAHGHLDNVATSYQNMCAVFQRIPQYIFLAHRHKDAAHTFQMCKVFESGSIIGTNNYSMKMRLISKPEQKLVIFEGHDVIDITVRVAEKD